ncbi:MAG TPA: prenyltransferase/squalene oxidase repeat-containing protein [Phycisphaerales bacterium]|nr:prenyltransferase/squalene oxidase repeat-containing protein [Phycisphaerales bacterium]
MRTVLTIVVAAAGARTLLAQPEARLSPAARASAYETLNNAITYLRAQQDNATGGWGVHPDGVTFPAITGLALDGMLQHPAIDASDPDVAAGLKFLLSFRQPDGGIYDRVLPSYNTAIAISALARAGTPEAKDAIPPAQQFLIGLQWSEDSLSEEVSEELGVGRVDRDHPFYGGVGYGSHGRPDLSNLSFMLQALHDSGYEAESPPFQRAIEFLERVQMDDRVNDMPYAAGMRDGGFIYATGPEADQASEGQSQAGTYEESLDDGTVVSRLRSYGSMTYAGFKSYIYAELPRNDVRVQAARDWIARNYTLEENPGLGDAGYYYYLVMLGRALDAWDEPTIESASSTGGEPVEHRWAEDLVTTLAELQQPDGSFEIKHDRWLENDPVLVTAYGVLALQAALDNN